MQSAGAGGRRKTLGECVVARNVSVVRLEANLLAFPQARELMPRVVPPPSDAAEV